MDDKDILSNAEKVELLSGEAQEIVGRVPPWIVRWGITVVFLLLLGFVAGSWLIRYPDELVVPATVFFEHQPQAIYAPVSGEIWNVAPSGIPIRPGDTLMMIRPARSGAMQSEPGEPGGSEVPTAVIASAGGTLSPAGGWSVSQNITQGELLGTIVPDSLGTPWVRADIPEAEAPNVRPGQRVLVRLEHYPAAEYGILEGRLESVSWTSVPEGSHRVYPARVVLDSGLATHFHITLIPQFEMRGTAHILSGERSLLDRMVRSLGRRN